MSWDVLLVPLPETFGSVGELPRDHKPDPIGSAAFVHDALRGAAADVDLSDPAWGCLDGATWSVELNIGHHDPVDSIMLHVRGEGDDVIAVIFQLAAAVGCRAIDCSTGEFLTADPHSWHAFQDFRDQIFGTGGAAP